MERFTISLLVISLLSLPLAPSIVPPFLATAQAGDDGPPSSEPYFINASGSAGQFIYRLSNPDGLGQPWIYIRASSPRYDEYIPLQTVFVYPNGTLRPLLTEIGSGEADLFGDGYIYVGGRDETWEAPAFRHIDADNRHLSRPLLNTTEGWLVISWDRLGNNDRYDHDLRLTSGTSVDLVSSASFVTSFEMADFREGHRLGAPHLRAHHGDRLLINSGGGQLYGFLSWSKTDYWSQGRFSLATDEWHWEIDYDNLTGGVEDHCTCFERGSHLFTTPSGLRAHLDFIGDGRHTNLYLLVAVHDDAVLPTFWQQFESWAPPHS